MANLTPFLTGSIFSQKFWLWDSEKPDFLMETQKRVYLCTYLLPSRNFFHFLLLSKSTRVLSLPISLRFTILSLAWCLQFIYPYSENPCGCPLFYNWTFSELPAQSVTIFLHSFEILLHTIQPNSFFVFQEYQWSPCCQSNGNVMSHCLSTSYPFVDRYPLSTLFPYFLDRLSLVYKLIEMYLYAKNPQHYQSFHLNFSLVNTNVHIGFA